jgi:predicted RNA-binding Zn-ribbon protein involved in translation (DUF1610 family)
MTDTVVPKAAAFNCTSCGAAIEMRAQGWAVTVVCATCGAQLDAADPTMRVLQYGEKMSAKPRIPLGRRGTWKGVAWEAIGYQEVEISVEGVNYRWSEYVCFNPYRGFLYLSEYEGHWNVIEKQRRRPERETEGERPTVTFDGVTYKHFQSSVAYTRLALGEFPWELRVGDQIVARDFVAPPYILSAEASDNEVTWSRGTYTPPDVIAKAFGLERLRDPVGVFANQPNPHAGLPKALGTRFGLAMVALVVMLVLNVVLSSQSLAFARNFEYQRPSVLNAETDSARQAALEPEGAALVTEPFTLAGRRSGVTLELSAPVDNDWMFLNLALINETTGEAREVARQISYYSGSDSDGRWSEGSRIETVRLAAVPAGRYFLRLQPEGGEPGRGPLEYRLKVWRDQPHYGLYALAFVALLLPMLIALLPSAAFESRRWAESDHAPSTASSDDE